MNIATLKKSNIASLFSGREIIFIYIRLINFFKKKRAFFSVARREFVKGTIAIDYN